VIFGAGLRSCAAAFLSSDKLRKRVAPTGTSTYSNVAIVLDWSRILVLKSENSIKWKIDQTVMKDIFLRYNLVQFIIPCIK